MTNKLESLTFLHDFIISNIPNNISQIELLFGDKINNVMFNTRLNLASKNNFDIIPIINRTLLDYFIEDIYPLLIHKVSNYYYDNYCYNIKQLYKKEEKAISYYNKTIINYNLIDNVCLKAISIDYKKPIYFTNMKTYNHKEKYTLLEWNCIHDVILSVKIYKTYFTFEIKILITENNKIPPNKMKSIEKIYKKMYNIYKNINNL